MRLFRPLLLAQLGEAWSLAGRVDEARTLAEEALRLARELGERGHEAYALRLLGVIAAHGDSTDVETAAGRCRDAMMLAEELGMHPLVAHCHLDLGTLYRRHGNEAKAREHLTTARAKDREMDMGFWLAQAEAAPGPRT